MTHPKLPDFVMVDWISDDLSYLRNLPQKNKDRNNGFYSPLKQAHDARLLIVFGHAMVEGYTKHVASRIGLSDKISTVGLIQNLSYPPSYLTVSSLKQLSVLLEGIKDLRHIIAHALTSDSAKNMTAKIARIEKAKLPFNPMELKEEHFNTVLEVLGNVINILGSGLVLHNRVKRDTSPEK